MKLSEILNGINNLKAKGNGDIDIIPEDMENLDIVLMGFHRVVRSTSKREQIRFIFKNINRSIFCSIYGNSSIFIFGNV